MKKRKVKKVVTVYADTLRRILVAFTGFIKRGKFGKINNFIKRRGNVDK